TAFALRPVGRTDLDKLRFCRDRSSDVRLHLSLIAGRVGAIVLLAQVGKQEFVMSCALGAFHATSRSRYKLRVALVEGCILQQQQHVCLNPEAKVADGEQDTRGLVSPSRIDLFEASGEAKRLHCRWQFG